MRNSVLDSYAVLAYLFGEPGSEKVISLLERALDAGKNAMIAAPNWAEVRYMVERKSGMKRWSEVREKLLALPIEIVSVDQEYAEAAGELKATRKMSLADCFAAALARRYKADLITGDPEFRAVEGDVKIAWI